MASPNNLRIIYQNLTDLATTTITASSSQSGSTGTSNLKLDTKSLVWRSTGSTASLIVNLGSAKQIGGIILAFSNLVSSTATMRVVGYSSSNVPSFSGSLLTTGIPTLFNTGPTLCCPWNNLNLPAWGTNPVNSSNYSYGGGTHARVWLTEAQRATSPQYLGIEINDPGNPAIELSRLIVGNYWSPVYNTGYGIEAGIEDLSEHERTESGDLLTRRGPRYRTLKFSLEYLSQIDRKELTKLFLGNGSPRPIFVSIFPDSTGDDIDFQREGLHQIYGKMKQIPGITYSNYEMYSSNIELEEI
jgi:hypothetical protein